MRIDDLLTRFLYWLHPPLKKERDLLLDKLQDYRNRLTEAEELATRLAVTEQKRRIEIEALKRPEAPAIFKAMTAAEVRKMMEREAFRESEKEN